MMENFWTFFSFPLNLLLALIWMTGWGWLYKRHSKCAAVRFLLSPAATVSSITLLLAACLWIGFSGDRQFVRSIFFVLVLLYLQTVLYLILLRGWKGSDGSVRWRFLLIHAGLLLALGAGFWGAPDSYELRVQLAHGQAAETAYRLDGSVTGLGYELKLDDHDMKVSDDGRPSYVEAFVSVDGAGPVWISVNHPYQLSMAESIYLTSVSEKSCVFQIVREPWRYAALAGIIMLLAGAFLLFIKGPRR